MEQSINTKAASETKRAAGAFDVTRFILISVSIVFLFVMLVLPLCTVILVSLRHGWRVYSEAVTDFYTLKALHLTIVSTVAAVAANTVFGLFAAWLLTKFAFRGKKLLTTAIDIPFAISPVIAGLVFILTFGRIGWTHPVLSYLDINIVFAVPGIILAVIFVTIPFVARELIPVLNSQGREEEEAAALMGAGGFTIFRRITLPNIKWALMYGVILCTARAMGEFGAVSVLSGHLRGKTNTLPLHVEILYNEYKYTESFAVSSILVILAVFILIARNVVEHKGRKGSGL
jgi:sulfate transport system permease protein